VDLVSGKLVGAEALARWEHPTRGLVLPLDFLPLAEETGLILPLGQWTLEEACRQARAWQKQFPSSAPLTVSVNLSGRQFQQPDLVRRIERILTQSGLEPSTLRLEVTEGVLLDDTRATLAKLEELRAMGVRLTIDDFGTGPASLTSLRRLPVRTLKLDHSLLAPDEAEAVAMVRALSTLAHALGMEVAAEGIETDEQLARLREAECDRGQGYLLSRPLPGEAMNRLLQRNLPLLTSGQSVGSRQ